MKIKKYRSTREVTEYSVWFRDPDNAGSFLSFDCDANGVPIEKQLTIASAKNYGKAIALDWESEIVTRTYYDTDPAVGICECGCKVVLCSDPNPCLGCQREYNNFGQQLRPQGRMSDREYWADELTVNSSFLD